VLVGTVDERLFGVISDEQQMLFTGVSMSESGEIGIARGQVFAVHRPAGDAVSPYGMGNALLLAIPALAAERCERAFGAGSSQTLFVLVPLTLVLAGAWVAGILAREAGAGETGAVTAAFAASLASPLWAYTGTGYSEPMQAVTLAGSALLALRVAKGLEAGVGGRKLAVDAVGAGLLAGLAVLAKAVNLVVVPFLLVPALVELLRSRFSRAGLRALVLLAAGGALPAGVWLGFEIARFGRPFSSYGGQDFTHPFLDGLWRLLVGPNEGLLLYFPPVLLAAAGLWLLARGPDGRAAAVALGAPLLVLLALMSSWWAWDGLGGWGPRFLVPAIPLLAAAAGVAAGRSSRFLVAARVLLALGCAVNLLGVLVPDTAVVAWVSSAPGVKVTREVREKVPAYFLEKGEGGEVLLPRLFTAGGDAAFSPLRLHWALLRLQVAPGKGRLEEGLARPPWLGRHPEAAPRLDAPGLTRNAAHHVLRSPFRWPRLGRAMADPRGTGETFNRAWGLAWVDQILRNLDIGRPERAVAGAESFFQISPSGYTGALLAESLRASGRVDTARSVVASLPPAFRASPSLGVVGALIARDTGDEAAARSILADVSRVFPRPGILAALERPVGEWPAGLHQMTGENLETRELALPKVGSGNTRPR
jgi:hypothetical protein